MESVLSLLRVAVRALLRMEKKLDETLSLVKKQAGVPLQGLNYTHQVCPLCNKTVEYYLVEVERTPEVARECGCTTQQSQYKNLAARSER